MSMKGGMSIEAVGTDHALVHKRVTKDGHGYIRETGQDGPFAGG